MTKKNFVSMLLGVLGGLLFALGMCMVLLPEWQAAKPGIVLGAAGMAVLAGMLLVRRKMAGKPLLVPLNARAVGTALLGIAGVLALGVGMCMCMVWNLMLPGILVGMVGILVLLCLIPLVRGWK